MRDLADCVAIVTGASRGIGPYVARALAGEHTKLVLAARSARDLESLSAELRGQGVRAIACPTDVRNNADLEALARVARSEFGCIDVLVNNAAIANLFPFHKLQVKDIERVIHVNLTSAMILARLVLPGMLERGRGHIVSISSIAAKAGPPYDEAYVASKAGLIGFTRSLRSEYRHYGVSASVICPGFVRGAGMSQNIMDKTGIRLPRFVLGCSPESVARSVVRAVRHDIPEILLGIPPMKPLSVLLELSPRLGEWLLARSGLFAAFGQAAKANEDNGGSLTGIGERLDRDVSGAALGEKIQSDSLFDQADEGIGRAG